MLHPRPPGDRVDPPPRNHADDISGTWYINSGKVVVISRRCGGNVFYINNPGELLLVVCSESGGVLFLGWSAGRDLVAFFLGWSTGNPIQSFHGGHGIENPQWA